MIGNGYYQYSILSVLITSFETGFCQKLTNGTKFYDTEIDLTLMSYKYFWIRLIITNYLGF